MAELQDIDESVGELEAIEELDQHVEQPKVEAAPVEDDIPEQFRGKSASEIAKYAAAVEKRLSKQGNELGEVRRLADELLKSQLMATKVEPEKPKEVDFFENPQEAMKQAVENNPRVLAVEQYARQVQQEQNKAKLVQMHPDVGSVIADQGFVDWVKASRIRTQMFQNAENYDLEAADELLSTYKALKAVKEPAAPKVEVDRKAIAHSLNQAAVETGGSGESSKKVYRRGDLINLKIRNPARYDAMQEEIYAAYQEGRVR